MISGAQQYLQKVLPFRFTNLKNPIACTYQIAIVRYVVSLLSSTTDQTSTHIVTSYCELLSGGHQTYWATLLVAVKLWDSVHHNL